MNLVRETEDRLTKDIELLEKKQDKTESNLKQLQEKK